MEAYANLGERGHAGALESVTLRVPHPAERKWDLAFLGVLAYLVIEYARLPTMYPWIRQFDVGKIAVGLSFLGLLLGGQTEGVKKGRVRNFDIALGLFLLASLASALGADSQRAAWDQMVSTTEWIIIYYIISRIVSNSWRTRIFVLCMLLLNLKLAQFAIRGYVENKALGFSDEFLSAQGVGAGITGFFANQGDFGVAMCVIWGFAAPLIFGESKILRRLFLLICFVAFTGALIVSGSRGALLGMAIVAGFSWIRKPKWMMGVGLILVVIMVGAYLLPEANKNRLRAALHPESDQTASLRLTLWESGMKMFYDHPVLGVGPGNFSSNFDSRYDVSKQISGKWAPHSIYIQSLSELGLAGTLPLGALWILFFRLNAKTRKNLQCFGEDARRRLEYRLSLGLDLGMVGFLASGAFLTVLYYPHMWILLGLSAGLHTACLKLKMAESAVEAVDQAMSPSNIVR